MILRASERTASGHRRYTESDLRRLPWPADQMSALVAYLDRARQVG